MQQPFLVRFRSDAFEFSGEVVVKIGQVPVTWVLDAATGRVLPKTD